MLLNKIRSSRAGAERHFWKVSALTALVLITLVMFARAEVSLSSEETARIGRKVWQNECNGTLAGLTSWNPGEDFASLGIGHFIWYPKGKRGPFEESFPKFLVFAARNQAGLPDWLRIPADGSHGFSCPWNSRNEFERANETARMKELRLFLAKTTDLQAQFLVDRLQQALPKMLAAATPSKRAQVKRHFDDLASSGRGCYALVDYVNFKGEGVLATERYAGQGWGLLQVLEGMPEDGGNSEAVKNFAQSAKKVLTNRVRNAPPARNESRWLPGWLNRISTYTQS